MENQPYRELSAGQKCWYEQDNVKQHWERVIKIMTDQLWMFI